MIYSPELAKLLEPYVSRAVAVFRQHALLPLKVVAVSAALVALPAVLFTAPVATPACVGAIAPLGLDTALEARSVAGEVVAPVASKAREEAGAVEKAIEKASEDGSLLDSAAPRRGVTGALAHAQ